MFRNKEALYSAIFIIALTAISAVVCFAAPVYGTYIILADGILYLSVVSYLYSLHYRSLRNLSEFLRRAQQEMIPLEISDQQEGEVSILKSELYKLLTKYHAQSELLEQDKRYLADTISDISHQLKTPMTSMNVMIDLLNEDTLPPEKRKEFTQTLHRQMSRMEWLLSAMLTMSRLDAGTIVLKNETVKVSDLICRASEHLLIPMDLHGQSLEVTGDLSVFFKGDLHWSSEALSNILKNCMEHTPDEGVIKVHAEGNSIYTGISIRDMGGGIPQKDLPHIFERFYRGENASADSVGIGLALAKQIITSQNGTIEVTSHSGE